MRAEIQKVLEMNKAGTLSDEQAASLLEELASRDKPKRDPENPTFDFGKPFSDFIQSKFGGSFARTGMGASDAQGNRVQMSKLEQPFGKEFVFKDNTVALSSVSRIELETAEMSGNSVNASKLDRVRVAQGKLAGSHVNGSSMDRIEILDSTVEALSVNGSKFSRFSVSDQSRAEDLHVDGCSFKSAKIRDASTWISSGLGASAVNGVELVRSTIKGSRIDASKVCELMLEDSTLDKVTVRAIKIEQLAFAGCEIKNSVFSGGESWRWQGIFKTRFENCKLDSARFSDCRMKSTLIRNVDLKDVDARGVDLSGMTLDGNEAFLAAIRAKDRA